MLIRHASLFVSGHRLRIYGVWPQNLMLPWYYNFDSQILGSLVRFMEFNVKRQLFCHPPHI